jgi:AcrR family transcriptional regulator
MSDSIPTRKQRRRRYRENLIEDILTIARQMMKADGVAALNFNGIARQLGMRPPSLYTYFDSKDAIYDELFRRGFEEFGRKMEARPHQDGSFTDNLRSAILTYMTFAYENPDLFQLMFQRPVPGFVPSEESMAVSLSNLARGREQMRAILVSGEIAFDLPLEEANDLAISMMYGLTELHLANNPELPPGQGRFGQLIEPAVQLFLEAWGDKQ